MSLFWLSASEVQNEHAMRSYKNDKNVITYLLRTVLTMQYYYLIHP